MYIRIYKRNIKLMKILFVGDASNFHNTLAHALRNMGHTCVVASDGSTWQQTDRNIDLTRKPGKLGVLNYTVKLLSALSQMRGFDIVHIVSPHFLILRPNKLLYIFNYLKKYNKHVFLSALGTDYQYVKTCYDGKTFRYSDYLLGTETSPYMKSEESITQKNWFLPNVVDYNNYVIQHIDGAIACLYEYYVSYQNKIPHKLGYGGIPIDTKALKPNFTQNEPDKVRFFIGIQKHRNILKGTDRLFDALKLICEKYPDSCEMVVAENVPYKEYIQMMKSSHVILDQLYSYTPATNALAAMAQGLIAVSGAEPEYYDFIGEQENRPIINISPIIENDIYNKLEWLVKNKKCIPQLSKMSRDFVVKHNDSHLVARRHIDFWNKIITKK